MTSAALAEIRRDYLRALNSGDSLACSRLWDRVRREDDASGTARTLLCSLGNADCDRQWLDDLGDEIARNLGAIRHTVDPPSRRVGQGSVVGT